MPALKNSRAAARHRAREIALQSLYAWKIQGGDAHEQERLGVEC